MTVAFYMILESELCLEGDVADGAGDPPACYQRPSTRGLEFLEKFLPQLWHWAREQGRVAGDLVPRKAVSSPKGFSMGLAGV